MDNFSVDVTSQGDKQFDRVMNLFNRNVVGYRKEDNILILYWCSSTRSTKLPYEMTIKQASEFAYGWLEQANYGSQPDHDGDNGKGWRIYNEAWGHIDGEWEAFVAIAPIWAMYGK